MNFRILVLVQWMTVHNAASGQEQMTTKVHWSPLKHCLSCAGKKISVAKGQIKNTTCWSRKNNNEKKALLVRGCPIEWSDACGPLAAATAEGLNTLTNVSFVDALSWTAGHPCGGCCLKTCSPCEAMHLFCTHCDLLFAYEGMESSWPIPMSSDSMLCLQIF